MKTRILFLSLISTLILAGAYSAIVASKAHPMIDKANAYVASLSSDQKEKGVFEFADQNRTSFEYLPPADVPRRGLSLKELSTTQDMLVHDLLRSSLSAEGYWKTEQIISLEAILKILEGGSDRRDVEEYYLMIFGVPAEQGTWGWRFEGHHLSLSFTMVDSKIATTPTFLGTNPAEVRVGEKKGLRVLAKEEDLAFDLLHSLSEDQMGKAIYHDVAPAEILTVKKSEVEALDNEGIPYEEMSGPSRRILQALVQEYIDLMPADLAMLRKSKLEATGWDKVYFAWAGAKEKGTGHYYRVQGPTFLIEFDNVQNNANHIHSVWRDFNGDFGRDLLREHYEKSPHHKH